MERNIDLIVANPAGNTTIMVLSPVAIEDYCRVSDELLRIDFGEYCSWADTLYGEQVAFITDNDGTPHMNMSGLEFCGNASRAFAYYCVVGNSSRADSASDSNCSDSAGNSSRADSAGDS